MDGNICKGTWFDETSSEFLCPLETTKQNRYSKSAEEIRTKITFVALVKFPGNVKY